MDHYAVLGLPTGEEGARLSGEEITRAYRSKARQLHPDKRPNDPHAHANFIQLQASYQLLKDKSKRILFDEESRKRGRLHQKKKIVVQTNQQSHTKRRRETRDMLADLLAREKEAKFQSDREKEAKLASQKLKEEIANLVAKNVSTNATKAKQGTTTESRRNQEVFNYKYPSFAEFQATEDSVLQKLQAAAKKQKQTPT